MVDLLCNFGADPEEAVEIAVCMVSHAGQQFSLHGTMLEKV